MMFEDFKNWARDYQDHIGRKGVKDIIIWYKMGKITQVIFNAKNVHNLTMIAFDAIVSK